MAYPAISLSTATAGRHRCPQKRLQTARQPPVYPIRARIIAPVTPLPPSPVLAPSIGGFGLRVSPPLSCNGPRSGLVLRMSLDDWSEHVPSLSRLCPPDVMLPEQSPPDELLAMMVLVVPPLSMPPPLLTSLLLLSTVLLMIVSVPSFLIPAPASPRLLLMRYPHRVCK